MAHLHVANLSQWTCVVNTINMQRLCSEKPTQRDGRPGGYLVPIVAQINA